MQYLMKQKLFCLGNDFAIKDAAGRDVYYVDGAAFTLLGERLTFQDMQGMPLAQIRQKFLSWGPTYEIWYGSDLAAVVKKHLFTFLRCSFSVDVPGPDDLEATGSFMDYEYTFTRAGQPVATVSKRFFALTDTYGVDIDATEDDVLILAATVVIDLCCHNDRRR
jgi:uncharacterized protein YxjI